MRSAAVQLEGIGISFGGLRAVSDVSIDIAVGERRVLLGPNGAGKTTLFNMIGGQLTPTNGKVRLFGEDVTALAPHRRAHKGLARTFQITSLFQDASVEENVHLAVRALSSTRYGMMRGAAVPGPVWERVRALLDDWRFTSDRRTRVCDLSYGDQRKLELAMAVAGEPRVLLLDEPTSGLSAMETESVVTLIKELPSDVTVIVVEHDMDVAFEVADRFTILQNGQMVLTGTAEEVRNNAEIRRIYFGEGE